MNVVILIGRLTREPELRYTPQRTPTATFTLAVDRESKNGGTDFPTVVAWAATAEFVSKYLHKGSKVAIRGRLQTRDYENRDGQRVYVTEVIADRAEFADSKPQEQPPFG